MKKLLKRIGSGLLVLFIILALIAPQIPASIFAATGTYTYNTGTRHDYNVSLSVQAQAYYTGNYTWDKLSALEGGNENCLDMDSPLFEALHNLMSTTMTRSVSYSSLPDYWKYTDASGGSSSYILFYKDTHGPDSSINREHVWPNSHGTFDKTLGGCDLHHLRPTNSGYNSSRGNLIMGNVRSVYSSYSVYPKNGTPALYKTSTIVEVNDNIKGDVARILLYVWCRWEEPNLFKNSSGGSGSDGGKVIESLDTLLEWCEIDPVDTWEMSRNDQVENVQGNRNVFIDYPEFAWLVFGQDVPKGINTPSGNDGATANPGGNNDNSGTTTTNPPATNPPATQAPATQPPVSEPSVDTSTPPVSEPSDGDSTQSSTPATQPSQPAPMPMASVNPDDFIVRNEPNNSVLIIIIAVAAAVLVAGAVVVYFVVIKPKKNAPAAAEDAFDEVPEEPTPDDRPEDTTENNE